MLPFRNLKRAVVALRRDPPKIVRATEYDGVSLEKAEKVHPSWSVQQAVHPYRTAPLAMTPSEPAWLFDLRNIDFWGRYGGSVVTADNCLLADLSPEVWGVENHPIFAQFRLPKAETIRGRVGLAVTPEAVGNYYHWLIDLLPRAALLKRHGFDSFDQVFLNGSGASYETASLEAIGLARVRYVNGGDRFQIDRAVIPSMDHHAKVIAPWKVEALRHLRDGFPAKTDSPRRIYVSRRQAAVRRIANENELAGLLRKAGFVTVELESCSWVEQVTMFSNAQVVLAPHGAALANIAFCQPGAVVAEINTRAGFREFFLQLAASANLGYRFIEAEPAPTQSESEMRPRENDDLLVSPQSIQDLLCTFPA